MRVKYHQFVIWLHQGVLNTKQKIKAAQNKVSIFFQEKKYNIKYFQNISIHFQTIAWIFV